MEDLVDAQAGRFGRIDNQCFSAAIFSMRC
jgi:hypothetical protein